MEPALHSPTLLLALKSSITGADVWMLAAQQQWPLATHRLHGVALGYGMVRVSHRVLNCAWCEA